MDRVHPGRYSQRVLVFPCRGAQPCALAPVPAQFSPAQTRAHGCAPLRGGARQTNRVQYQHTLRTPNIAPLMPVRCGPKPKLSDSEMLTVALCALLSLPKGARNIGTGFPPIRRPALAGLSPRPDHAERLQPPHPQTVLGLECPGPGGSPGTGGSRRPLSGAGHRAAAPEAPLPRPETQALWGRSRHRPGRCRPGLVLRLQADAGGHQSGGGHRLLALSGQHRRPLGRRSLLCWRAGPLDTPISPQEMPPRRNGQKHVGPNGPQWPRHGPGQPTAAPYLGDNGFFGAGWQRHWPYPNAYSRWGFLARVPAKVATLNLGIRVNRQLGRPDLAQESLAALIALDIAANLRENGFGAQPRFARG